MLAAEIVAEAVGTRLQRREGLDVCLLLRGIHASRREGDVHLHPGVLRGLFDRGAAAENDEVGERDPLAAAGCSIELVLDCLELLKDGLQLSRLVDLPVPLWREADARAVGSATLV